MDIDIEDINSQHVTAKDVRMEILVQVFNRDSCAAEQIGRKSSAMVQRMRDVLFQPPQPGPARLLLACLNPAVCPTERPTTLPTLP